MLGMDGSPYLAPYPRFHMGDPLCIILCAILGYPPILTLILLIWTQL